MDTFAVIQSLFDSDSVANMRTSALPDTCIPTSSRTSIVPDDLDLQGAPSADVPVNSDSIQSIQGGCIIA